MSNKLWALFIITIVASFYIGVGIGRVWQMGTGWGTFGPDSVVISDRPGKCPICGDEMDFITLRRADERWGLEIWICDLH